MQKSLKWSRDKRYPAHYTHVGRETSGRDMDSGWLPWQHSILCGLRRPCLIWSKRACSAYQSISWEVPFRGEQPSIDVAFEDNSYIRARILCSYSIIVYLTWLNKVWKWNENSNSISRKSKLIFINRFPRVMIIFRKPSC